MKTALIAMSARRITKEGITQIKGMEINKMKKYTLDQVLTMSEAAERYDINLDTLKSRLKPSLAGQDRLDQWQKQGIIKKSGKTWLITEDFLKIISII